jgi:imidazolonepropionase-like amidohydrolase
MDQSLYPSSRWDDDRIGKPLKKFVAILVGLVIVLAACARAPTTPLPSPTITPRLVPTDSLVITNGIVIDGTGAPPIANGIVIISQNKIAAVGRAADFAIPTQANTIDAQGNTIMPGIINAHVHDAASPLVRQFYFLQRGVTSVCDVGSSLTALTRAREPSSFKITARGFFSGPIINAPNGYPGAPELLYAVTNPREARLAVSDLVRRGADYIKIALEPWNWKLPWPIAERDAIPNLSLAELQAIVDQAHQEGKLVRAHLGTAEMLDLALESGVDAFEHVPLPRLEDIDFRTNSSDYADLSAAYEAQLARIVQHNVIMTPTLDKIISWCESYAVREERKILCRKYALTPVYRFHQMGGIVALGDDSASDSRTWMPIQEMRRLLEAGLTPMEVIQAGTLYAARVCGHRDELGTLAPGTPADVIIVAGNPLKNIDAMNNVRVVIINGQVAVPAK